MTDDGDSDRDEAQSEESGDGQGAPGGDGVSTAANLDRKFKGGGGGGGGGGAGGGSDAGGGSSNGGSGDGGAGEGIPTPPRGPPTPPGNGDDADGGSDAGGGESGGDHGTPTPPRGPPTPPGDSGSSPEFVLGEDQVDLLNFRPPGNVRRRVDDDAGGHVQFIENGASDLVNLDRYAVRLSGFEDHQSMDDVFEYLRLSFGDYFAASGGEFFGYDDADATQESQWQEDPHGSVMVFDLHSWMSDMLDMMAAATSVSNPVFTVTADSPHHFGPVVATMSGGYEWTFSTARTAKWGLHPISGNRRFRLEPVGDEYEFVIEGVDRVSSMLYDLARSTPDVPHPVDVLPDLTPDFFELGHQAWMNFNRAIVDDVERRGGSAEIQNVFSERYPWDEVRDRYWDG